MKKVRSPIIDKEYWIGVEDSPDGLPVFSPEEVEMIRKSKDTMPKEMFIAIYNHKATFGGTLQDITQSLMDRDDPHKDLGYNMHFKEEVKPKNLDICKDIITMLKPRKREDASEADIPSEMPIER
jgi:hypothetical protein